MISNAVCVINPVVQSNTLSLNVIAIPTTGVTIASSAVRVCQDSVVVFTATPINGGATPGFQWQVNGVNGGVGSDSPVFPDGGLQNGDAVNCIMTGSLTCSQPATAAMPITMTIYPLPGIVMDTAVVIAGGASILLQPVISGDVDSLNWTPATWLSDAYVATPVATPVVTTAYTLNVVTVDGCKASATEVVKVYYDLKMPGGFTPNGDGHNDVFRVPPSVPVLLHRLAVYNRQGALLFTTSNVGDGWDGTFGGQMQPAGAYIWYVEFVNPVTKQVEARKGVVVLVR
jgi:gliding motility-associated-like protein